MSCLVETKRNRSEKDVAMIDRAPRERKRLLCEIRLNESRYSGIAIDVSATGLFVQTSVKPNPGEKVEIRLSLPGCTEPVVMTARVARKKMVPAQLLTLAQGGVGLALVTPDDAYLDFVATMSLEHAEAVARLRAAAARSAGGGATKADSGPVERNAPPPPKRFRIHAVESATGKKNAYLATCSNEAEACEELLKQLGEAWQVLFVERV
jgi:hypothetical protein